MLSSLMIPNGFFPYFPIRCISYFMLTCILCILQYRRPLQLQLREPRSITHNPSKCAFFLPFLSLFTYIIYHSIHIPYTSILNLFRAYSLVQVVGTYFWPTVNCDSSPVSLHTPFLIPIFPNHITGYRRHLLPTWHSLQRPGRTGQHQWPPR